MIKHTMLPKQHEEYDIAITRIDEGQFKGVEFGIVYMTVNEDDKGLAVDIEFDVTMIPDSVDMSKKEIEDSDEFQIVIKEFVNVMIDEYVKREFKDEQ